MPRPIADQSAAATTFKNDKSNVISAAVFAEYLALAQAPSDFQQYVSL